MESMETTAQEVVVFDSNRASSRNESLHSLMVSGSLEASVVCLLRDRSL